jgi:hypothetical protein
VSTEQNAPVKTKTENWGCPEVSPQAYRKEGHENERGRNEAWPTLASLFFTFAISAQYLRVLAESIRQLLPPTGILN